MSTSTYDFELENVAAGPDPFRLSAAAADVEAVVLLFQRDYHCVKCRRQVQDVAERYEEFEAADALVAAVGRLRQDSYDLPYPLLADPATDVGDEYDQPTRFGIVGSLHDFVGRMPMAVVLDSRSGTPEIAATAEGSTPGDRPSVDDFLAAVQDLDAASL